MTRVLVGTCSWTDPTLLQSGFYPKGVNTAESRLGYYAQNFSIVEVDSTYYSLLSQATAVLWCQRTPQDFTFDVKAFSLFTHHPTQVRALPKEIREGLSKEAQHKSSVYYRDLAQDARQELWQRFRDALLPLDSAGKLGVVLFQFPQWFLPYNASKEHILSAKEQLSQYKLAIEFRNDAWLDERRREDTFRFLRENNLPFVCVDEPQGFKSSVPPIAEATSSIAVVRFHGKNREMWEKKGITASERFRYLYSGDELAEWVPKIEQLSSQTQETHVLMNNCYRDHAVVNARQIALMLD